MKAIKSISKQYQENPDPELNTRKENLKFEKYIIEILYQSARFDLSKISQRHTLNFEKIILNQKSITLIQMERKGYQAENYTSLIQAILYIHCSNYYKSMICLDFYLIIGNARVSKIIDSIKTTFEDKIYTLKSQDDDIIIDIAKSNKSVINYQSYSLVSINQIEEMHQNIQTIEYLNNIDIQVCIRFEYQTGIVTIQGILN